MSVEASVAASVPADAGGRGGGRGGGGRGGGRPRYSDMSAEEKRRTAVSKTLSWMLRHHAADCGLHLRPDGYAPMSEVLAYSRLSGVPVSLVEEIVATCPKQRFSIIEDGGAQFIRANQGHSEATAAVLDDEAMLERVTDASTAPVCVHGTYRANWEAIRASGLKRMSRKHMHFAAGELGEASVKSGLRTSAQIYVYLDVPAALAEGLVLYRSANNVLLTSGFGPEGVIPTRLFLRAVDSRTGEVLWPLSEAASSGAGAGSGASSSSGAVEGASSTAAAASTSVAAEGAAVAPSAT